MGNGIEKDSAGKYTVTDQNKGNAANIGDVQNMVNEAVNSAADTTNRALAGKANVDASNIGANLKGEDAEKTANENAWGSAIGTGKIEKDNGQLVTGKTVYEYNKPVAEDGKTLNYISEGKTTGQNLGALDAHVKANADEIAQNTKDISEIKTNVRDLTDNAVQYDNDSKKSKITLAGEKGTTITNVKDGSVGKDSKDAVNGGQLFDEKMARENADTKIKADITKIKDGEGFTEKGQTVIKSLAQDAVDVKGSDYVTVTNETKDGTKTFTVSVDGNGKVASGDKGLISGDTIYNELRPATDGTYIKTTNTTAQNLTSLDTQVKKTSDLINSDGKTIKIGGSDAATKIDVNGNDGKGRVITGVVSDANDPTSAANVGYVNGVTAANTQQIYRDMNNAYGRLNNNINKAAAGSNALAALHPLDYDPDDKADFAVGYGHYRNANAAAVGAFYHPNENTMVNVGVSLGNGDPGFNAGVSFKVGRGGAGREAMSKTEMAKVINSQSKEIDALKKDNADKDKRIDALEQKMAEILAKLDKNGK
ncbi:YadA-like family protein [Dialister succinatiphilus]|uniref:YadA-like family protein n=1 Tax=Dialister succinatiphilus TaxID=487173 RepID=UPI00402806A1